MKYGVRAKQRMEEEPVRQWYKRQIGVLDKETRYYWTWFVHWQKLGVMSHIKRMYLKLN